MKRLIAAAAFFALGLSPVFAQSTAVGVGEASSNSLSRSQALSVSRSGGGRASASNTFNTPANTTNSTRISGTTTTRNVPGIVAPGLAAAGIETCLGSVSGGVAFPGGGFSFGSTTPDRGCDTRLDARTLWAFGLKGNAIARLCQKEEMRAALGAHCGQPQQVATVQTAAYSYPPAATSSPSAAGGIWLINGRTRKEQYCLRYDAPARRCRAWQ